MDEWQRRMKAEKEAERQKKSASADLLRGYRGGDVDEEAKKLKAAREEERRKKDEAQKALQEYKGSDMEEVKKLKAQREEELRKKQDAQSNLHDYKSKDVGESGPRRDAHYTHHNQMPIPVNRLENPREENVEPSISVSERAAHFAGRGAPAPPSGYGENSKAVAASDVMSISPNETVNSQNDNLLGEPIQQSSLSSEPTKSNGIVSNQMDLGSATNEIAEDLSVLDDKAESEAPSSMNNSQQVASLPSSSSFDEEHTAVKEEILTDSNEAESATEMLSTMNSYSVPVEEEHTVGKEDILPEDVESKSQKQQSNIRERVRLDVLFSFGLVTIQTDPTLDPYMNAVEEVVLKAIAGDASLAAKVAYNKNHKPYVKSTLWDRKYYLCWLIGS